MTRAAQQRLRRVRAASFALAAFAAFVTFGARPALGNGRFPNAEQLRPLPGNALVVTGTYGLLVSGNQTDFQYVCESSLFGATLMGSWVDPLIEVLPDGTILSGSPNGLRVSRDRGCSFTSDWSLPHSTTFIPPDPSATGPAGKVVDLCPAYDQTGGVIALTTVTNSDGSVLEHRLYRTIDNAQSWQTLGAAIPTSQARTVLTVDVAPSDPTRIYVSGNSLGTSVLLSSLNGGTNFSPQNVTLADNAGVLGLYIAAVSPVDPKRVYLRANRRSDINGVTSWDDSLLVTDDGGVTANDVLRKEASLLGFALSPDGQTVLAGYGDPFVPPETTNPDDLGLYSADATSLTFAPLIAGVQVSCLRWTSDALYACATEQDPLANAATSHDFHVGRFAGSGLPASLSDFTTLVKLKDVRGPLPNQDGSPSACAAEWATGDPTNPGQASVCTTFNACGTQPALSAGAIQCMAASGAGGTAGSGGANAGQGGAAGSSTGGAGQAGSASGSAGSPSAAGAPAAGKDKGGCGCRVGAGGTKSSGWLLTVLGALTLARRRRLATRGLR